MVWPGSRVERLSDEALLAAVGLGDQTAATAFVRRFQRRVFGLALAVTLDAAAAEDVAQSAFERAWRHAAAYDERRGSVATWLLTITRNLAIDSIRVRRPAPMEPGLIAELVAPDTRADPLAAAALSDDVDRVRAALGRLPREQRRAILLATIAGRTSAEIAELEGVPVPTAKHRIQSAVRKLRLAVREEAET